MMSFNDFQSLPAFRSIFYTSRFLNLFVDETEAIWFRTPMKVNVKILDVAF